MEGARILFVIETHGTEKRGMAGTENKSTEKVEDVGEFVKISGSEDNIYLLQQNNNI